MRQKRHATNAAQRWKKPELIDDETTNWVQNGKRHLKIITRNRSSGWWHEILQPYWTHAYVRDLFIPQASRFLFPDTILLRIIFKLTRGKNSLLRVMKKTQTNEHHIAWQSWLKVPRPKILRFFVRAKQLGQRSCWHHIAKSHRGESFHCPPPGAGHQMGTN
jgi:hypothetical protein